MDEIHLSPLSFKEYFNATNKEKTDAWQDYLNYGGLPHILKEDDKEEKVKYLEKLNKEIYLKDLTERYQINEQNNIEILMKIVASSTCSLLNPNKISNTFISSGKKKISSPTISLYLKYLEESFIIQKAERYDIKGRKYISTPVKYFLLI